MSYSMPLLNGLCQHSNYMNRLLVVYNPRSSRYSDVRKEVLDRLTDLKGYIIGKYEVTHTNIEDNILKLSKLLKDGDLVISAGGDATGVIASSAILKSGKDATLAVLPYGNFNDLSHTLGTKTLDSIMQVVSSEPTQSVFYPLEIYINDKFYRYATCYVTIGMMGEAVKIYDSPSLRRKLKTNFGRKISSYTQLAKWYFKNRHKRVFLPDFKLNDALQPSLTSDYAAVNGRYMARVMKGREDFKNPNTFRSKTDRLTNFWRLFNLMARSILFRIPGSNTTSDTLKFIEPATITLQSEGESTSFQNVKTINIRKSKKCLKVITI